MSKSTNKYLTITLCICIAALCNILAHIFTDYRFINKLLNSYRTFFYIGLFSSWGFSVRKRVMQPQVRSLLTIVSLLMVFWQILRVIKYRFIIDYDAIRLMWYIYYIPFLIIPSLAVLISISLGKPYYYRLPITTCLTVVPSIILILLVLTNDLHELVFSFPDGMIRSEEHYNYSIIYYTAVFWIIACSVTTIIIMLSKSRVPRSHRVTWIPFIPFVIALLYGTLFALNIPYIRSIFGDMAICFCLFFTGFFESCIWSGLIPSNTMYDDLFRKCSDMSVLIVDNNNNIYYSSYDSEPIIDEIPFENIKESASRPTLLTNGKRLHSMPVDGGHAVWTEDTSALINLRETLSFQQDELAERNSLLIYEYEKEKQHETIKEQNRLYDLLQKQTQKQLNDIDRLVRDYQSASHPHIRRNILSYVMVLGTYIKRKKDFVLSSDSSDRLSESMLCSALEESYQALKTLGLSGSHLVDIGNETIPSPTITAAYDFFETVVEYIIADILSENVSSKTHTHFVNTRICHINSFIRINILTDIGNVYNSITDNYPGIDIVVDEDGIYYILDLQPEGGDIL